MSLSRQQRKEIYEALLDAFRTESSLEQMLSFGLDKKLKEIAGEGNLQQIIFRIIETAEAQGWIKGLIDAAKKANPGNQLLKAIALELLQPEPPTVLEQSPPRQSSLLQLEVFQFETVKVQVEEKKGFMGRSTYEVKLNRRHNQAKHFVEDLGYGVTLEMVEIPGGVFTMGASTNEEGSRDSERPIHQVTLKPFFIGKYSITQEQWEKVAAFLPRVNRDLNPRPSRFKGDRLPVETISWFDAVEFCDRLSKKTGRKYRLPTEAEWEYACRAGTTTPFYFGQTITTEVANYNGNAIYGNAPKGESRDKTTDVGSFPANAFGLYDMHGNVWEWCLDDWRDNYEGAPTDGSAWFNNNLSQIKQLAVLRGGCWINLPENCRSASRFSLNRAERDSICNSIGFRVVCAAA